MVKIEDNNPEDDVQSEETKKVQDAFENIGIRATDAKRYREIKRSTKSDKKQKSDADISFPVSLWDDREKFLGEVKNLPAQDAIDKIKKKLAEDFDFVVLWVELGEIYLKNRNYNDAVSAFKTALIKEPQNKIALKKLAWTYEELKQWSDANNCWNEIYKQDDKNIEAISGLAYTFLKLDEGEKSMEFYMKILEIDERNVTALDNMGYLHWFEKKYTDAIDYLKKSMSLERDVDDDYAERYLADCYYRLEQHEDCEKIIDILINEKKTNDWYIYYLKSGLLIEKDKLDLALGICKQSIMLKQSQQNTFQIGRIYAIKKKWELAILYYEKSLELENGKKANTLVNLANCYEDYENNLGKKLELCEEALEIEPTFERALLSKISCYQKMGEHGKVMKSMRDFEMVTGKSVSWEVLEEVVESTIELNDEELGLGWEDSVRYYVDGQNGLDLIEYLKQLIEASETEEQKKMAEKWKIYAWFEHENDSLLSLSLKMLEEAIEKWPEDSWFYERKGDVLAKQETKLDEAIENYNKALEILSKDTKENSKRRKYELLVDIAKVIKSQGNLISKSIGYDSPERKEKNRDAIDKLSDAEELIDDDWESWYEKGNCYWNLRDYNLAFESYEKASEFDPSRSQIWTCLGDTSAFLDSDDEAILFYEKAIKVGKKQGELEKTLGMSTRNDWVDAQTGLIRCLYYKDERKRVLLEIEKVFEIGKIRKITDVYIYKALTLGELNRHHEAIDVYKLGLKDFDEDEDMKHKCLYNMSHQYDKAGLKEEAKKWAHELIDSGIKDSADGYQLLGRFLRDEEKYVEAIEMLEEHLASFGNHGKKEALKSLRSCYDRLGNKEKKEEYEKRLKELEEKD